MTEMAEMTLHANVPEGADAQALAEEVRKRLAALSDVAEVDAAPESTRFAGELVAAIAITVAVIKGAGDIAEALHAAIPKIKLVLQDLGMTKAQIEVAGERVAIEEVSRAHTRKMSA